MTKQWRNIREMGYIQKNNQKIRSLQIIDNIYMCVCVCVCVCDYTTEKYKRKICYHQNF